MYHLYKYKVYTDVRLVFAPEYMIAKFGGDPDNFCFPRYALDICFFRVYEKDRPLSTPYYLKWGARYSKKVISSLLPAILVLRDGFLRVLSSNSYEMYTIPFSFELIKGGEPSFLAYSSRGSEETRVALTSLLGVENSLKAITGYQSGLLDANLIGKKTQEEKSLRETIRNADLEKEYGKAWDEIAEAQKEYAAIFKPLQFFEKNLGFNSAYFSTARNLVRLAQESEKPNGERLKNLENPNIPP